MPLKKSELYSSLWRSCDGLRGGMDASQYKDYVLVLLFVKYVSDKAATNPEYLLDVPAGGSFADLVKLKGNKDIGEGFQKVVEKLAAANDLKGVIDVADWNDPEKLGKGKEMVDRLSNLVGIFEGLDFRANRADGDDLLGDAYEYLMRHFATESGKSKGQFYTPAEVSRIMAKVVGVAGAKNANQTIHDPACGSGSLLLKAHDEAKEATGLDLALYGQEMDNATKALAKMNLILHDCPTGEIWQDNTLSSPHFRDDKTGALKTFDFVVANPPFSTKAWTSGLDPANDVYGRFAFGVPPPKNGDYAFLLHVLACLKSTGKGAIILPHGVLFRGGAEATIRKEIVRRGYLKGIIGLPANLFYGTGIPACILVLAKEGAAGRKGVFMIDASKGFLKDGPKNRLRAQDIHRIVDMFNKGIEAERYSRMVPLAEIADAKNDYNLNLPRYVDTSEPEDIQDIDGHLRGGIPDRDVQAMGKYWDVLPGVREALFEKGDRPGYWQLKVPAGEIKATVFGHPAFTAWSATVGKRFDGWKARATKRLRAIEIGEKPKALVTELAEDLLATFEGAPLLDGYDVYQHLMDYWAETMQDDVYAIASEGWLGAAKPRVIVEEKGGAKAEKADFVVGKQKMKADLVPPGLVIARWFAKEQAALDALEAERAAAAAVVEEMLEEHGGEEGLLAEVTNEKGKVGRAAVVGRLRVIKMDRDAADQRKVLTELAHAMEVEVALAARVGESERAVIDAVAGRYARLTEEDARAIVVGEKWMAAIEGAIRGEAEQVSLTLALRLEQLARRYAGALARLAAETLTLEQRVAAHLKLMGGAS